MEYLRGESLEMRLEREPRGLSSADVIRYGRQISATLPAAHARGILHGDVKPAHLMLVPSSASPGGEQVRVLSFAWLPTDMGQDQAGPIDAQNQLIGTPIYMSPEHRQGKLSLNDKSDVYSLGILFYQRWH